MSLNINVSVYLWISFQIQITNHCMTFIFIEKRLREIIKWHELFIKNCREQTTFPVRALIQNLWTMKCYQIVLSYNVIIAIQINTILNIRCSFIECDRFSSIFQNCNRVPRIIYISIEHSVQVSTFQLIIHPIVSMKCGAIVLTACIVSYI